MTMSRTLLAVILKMSFLFASSGRSGSSSTVAIISLEKRSEIADVLLGFSPKMNLRCSSSGLVSGSSPPKRPAFGSISSAM